MNRTKMVVYILLLDDGCVTLPVLCCLFREKIVLICKRPPYISVCAYSGDEIFPVKIITLCTHLAESPAVIWMHYDQICLNAKRLQLLHTPLDMPEMRRIEPGQIEVISLRLSGVLLEIVFREHSGIHRRSLIRVGARLAKIVIIMLRENAETDFVKGALL